MGKHIWVIHHYADPPDGYWTGTYELYKHLVAKGYQVTVFSSSFNHYSRKEERLRPHEQWREQVYDGMRFIFVRTIPYMENNWRRLANMVSFGVRAFWIGLRLEFPDVIVASTPHPFAVAAGLLLARRKRCRFFLELHDLWTEYLLDTGMISPRGLVAKGLKWLESLFYERADKILVLWSRMDQYVVQYGIPPDKIVWLPLGVDCDTLPRPPLNDHRNGSPFVAVCTARFGPASNVSEILEAAKILMDTGKTNIKFVLIGAGPEEEKLLRYAREAQLRNVEFRGLVHKEEIPRQLAEADFCIAGLPDIPNYKKYGIIPTKLVDYMASNRPAIFITSVYDSILERARGGFVVPPGQPSALAEALIQLVEMSPERRLQLAENAFRYLKENHDLRMLASRLESLL